MKIVDWASEILALEDQWMEAQARASTSLVSAAQLLQDNTLWPFLNFRRQQEALQHLIKAIMEIKTVQDGLAHGLTELFKSAMEYNQSLRCRCAD